jgi:PA14 domain
MRFMLLLGFALAAQEQQPMARFGTTVLIPDGLRGQIYFLKPDTAQLPNVRKLKPVGTIYTTSLNIPVQSFDRGFPGVTGRFEWFAIDYTGRFWARYAGIYRFNLLSDDGSRLWIDGKLVVDNNGIHAPQQVYGDIHLESGLHRIELAYFQGPRFQVALVLMVAPPAEGWAIFDVDHFKPPPGAEVPPDAIEGKLPKRSR